MKQRRTNQRIAMKLPVDIQWKSRTGVLKHAKGETSDISGNGLFVEVPVRPRCSAPVTFTVTLPSKATEVPLELQCQGRVVRWDKRGRTQGLAAVIDEYELRPVPRRGLRKRASPPK